MTPDRQDDGLLPCPFCRRTMQFRKALHVSDGNVDGIIHAEPSDCPMSDFADGSTDESIIAKWNSHIPSRDAAEGAEETDEFGYFDLGRSFYEEFTRLSNDGNFKGFICGCSPVEILVHLINERDEALAPVPPSDALRQNADHAHDTLYGFASVPPADGARRHLTDDEERLVRSALAGSGTMIEELPSPAVAADPDGPYHAGNAFRNMPEHKGWVFPVEVDKQPDGTFLVAHLYASAVGKDEAERLQKRIVSLLNNARQERPGDSAKSFALQLIRG